MATESSSDILGITSLIEQGQAFKRSRVVPKQHSRGFIRIKYIHGRPYYYLVRSFREGGKVKQKVLKYLGARKPRAARIRESASARGQTLEKAGGSFYD